MDPAIEIRDLHKHYGATVAVDGVSLSVTRGEILGLLGPNGAGKTTTVECVLGLRRPDSGRIQILGSAAGMADPAIRTLVGVQLQTTGLLPQLTAREQLILFAGLFPRARAVDEMLEQVGLRDKARTATKALSGGQKQRLAVALALVNDPELIFLDEPTTGLDPQARRGLWDVVRALREAGKTVLLTTHYMEEAEQLCDRVAIMDGGRIIEEGSPAALINKHFHETAIEFVPLNGTGQQAYAMLPAVAQTIREDGHITLYSTDVPRTMAGLFTADGGHSLAFTDMTVRQATLEDVFLKLTGRRIRT